MKKPKLNARTGGSTMTMAEMERGLAKVKAIEMPVSMPGLSSVVRDLEALNRSLDRYLVLRKRVEKKLGHLKIVLR